MMSAKALGLFVSGLFLIPGGLWLDHQMRTESGQQIAISAGMISHFKAEDVAMLKFETPLHHLDTELLAGENRFRRGERICVYLAPGLDGLWQPLTLARRTSRGSEARSENMMICGKVKAQEDNIVQISYSFDEVFLPRGEAFTLPDGLPSLSLTVSQDGHARFLALNSDELPAQSPSQVLRGGKRKDTTRAPAT